jgi:hypothetical protein
MEKQLSFLQNSQVFIACHPQNITLLIMCTKTICITYPCITYRIQNFI